MYTQPYRYPTGRRTRLRVAGGLLVALGVGHTALLLKADRDVPRAWLSRGLVDTVQIGVFDREPPTPDLLRERTHFWAGLGSFAAPTAMLGLLAWRAGDRDAALPRWLGPGLVAWSAVAGAVMPRAPWALATAAGGLISSAASPR